MGDLLQSQIRDSCRLALPEGLKDLMSDISREVLRAQPQDLYQFIADYLSALLVAREHLFIAARVCDDVCLNRCCQELVDELREMSLSEEDVQKSLDIIAEYFSSGAVKEGNLLQNLMQKTDIRKEQLPFVQEAVRRAFLRHQVNHTAPIESSSTDSDMDETMIAAKHTLKIYKKVTEQPDINYNCVASKIQAAYRAYNVRRKLARAHKASSGKRADSTEKGGSQVQLEKPVAELVKNKRGRCTSKCSSESLAGSFVSLPLYKPYHSIDDKDKDEKEHDEAEKEKEHANFDYITNVNSLSPQECHEYNETNSKKEKKIISFHSLPKVVEVDYSEAVDEMGETEYEFEEIDENLFEEEVSDEEKVIAIAGHGDGYGDEMPTIKNLRKDGASSDETDDEVQETETQRTTKDLSSDDSSEVTTDDDLNVNDDISSEISPKYDRGDDDEEIVETFDSVADNIDPLVENEADDDSRNIQL